MSTPITVHYQETAFTLPWDDNRQVLHDQAYQALLNGEHVDNEKRARTFVYDLQLISKDVGLGLACARAQSFHPEVQAQEKKLVVREGDQVTIKARLSGVKRASRARSGQGTKHTFVTEDNAGEWAVALLARHGMDVDSLTLEQLNHHKVLKPSMGFGLQEVVISAQVRISDATGFVNAFLNGMGRHKGYGLGMMEVTA